MKHLTLIIEDQSEDVFASGLLLPATGGVPPDRQHRQDLTRRRARPLARRGQGLHQVQRPHRQLCLFTGMLCLIASLHQGQRPWVLFTLP